MTAQTAPEGREYEWDALKPILSKLAQYRDETLQKPDYMDVQEAEAAISVWLAAHDQALIQRVRELPLMQDEPESWVEGIIPKPPNREKAIIRNQFRYELRAVLDGLENQL